MIDFSPEIKYNTARSGGKGGQNVNKVETMAEARWPVRQTSLFTAEEQERILLKCARYINKEGELTVRSSESRSQLENKAIALRKLQQLVTKALTVPKARKSTRIPKAVIEKRLESKRINAEKKQSRRRDF